MCYIIYRRLIFVPGRLLFWVVEVPSPKVVINLPSVKKNHIGSMVIKILRDRQTDTDPVTFIKYFLILRVEEGQLAINITGGPLAYKYQFQVNSILPPTSLSVG